MSVESFDSDDEYHDALYKEAAHDVRYLMPKTMKSWLRIDLDVKNGLEKLASMIKDYAQFDVLSLTRKMTRTLEMSLDQSSKKYRDHKAEVLAKLAHASSQLVSALEMKDNIVSMRQEKLSDLMETFKASKEFQKREVADGLALQA